MQVLRSSDPAARQRRAEYLQQRVTCELWQACKLTAFPKGVRLDRHDSTVVHHVWGRNGLCEHPSNYAAVCDGPGGCHEWLHENLRLGRVVLCSYKASLRREAGRCRETIAQNLVCGTLGDWDTDALRTILGRDVLGTLEAWRDSGELGEWVEDVITDLLQFGS